MQSPWNQSSQPSQAIIHLPESGRRQMQYSGRLGSYGPGGKAEEEEEGVPGWFGVCPLGVVPFWMFFGDASAGGEGERVG